MANKLHSFYLDFTYEEYVCECLCRVQLPDYNERASDIDYYGFREIVEIEVYKDGNKLPFFVLPKGVRNKINFAAHKALKEHLHSADVLSSFADETGGF